MKKLSKWAKENDMTYQTAWNLVKNDKLPIPFTRLDTGTILVHDEPATNTESKVYIYGRVSSHDQKKDLKRQLNRLRDFCSSKGLVVSEELTEIASGLNCKRPKLNKILESKERKIIVVEHKDRLTRFGFGHIESALKATDSEILTANESDLEDDIVQDFIDVVTSMCARIYGKRSAQNKARKIIEEVKNEDS